MLLEKFYHSNSHIESSLMAPNLCPNDILGKLQGKPQDWVCLFFKSTISVEVWLEECIL